MGKLFTPFKLRGIEFRNRVFLSPMCQYSAQEGMPDDWHLVHLGSRAAGGAGQVLVRVTRSAICGSDMGADNSAYLAKRGSPGVVGHESMGVVAESRDPAFFLSTKSRYLSRLFASVKYRSHFARPASSTRSRSTIFFLSLR